MCRKIFLLYGLLVTAQATADVRDPTQPLIQGAVRTQTMQVNVAPKLTSVLIGNGRRLAVVDGSVMSEGEERAGVKLWKIKPDRVVVSIAGQRPMTLKLDAARIHKEVR